MRFRLSIVLPVAVIALSACGGDTNSATNPTTPTTPTQTNQVNIGNDFFSPANISVPVNTTVQWTWSQGDVTHNVTFDDGATSGDKNAGDTYARLFATAGTFAYHCTIHAGMTGSVLVTQ